MIPWRDTNPVVDSCEKISSVIQIGPNVAPTQHSWDCLNIGNVQHWLMMDRSFFQPGENQQQIPAMIQRSCIN